MVPVLVPIQGTSLRECRGYSRVSNKRMVWNKLIGWKTGSELISVWYGILVRGGKIYENSVYILLHLLSKIDFLLLNFQC